MTTDNERRVLEDVLNDVQETFTQMKAEYQLALEQTSLVLHIIGLHPGYDWRQCPIERCRKNSHLLDRRYGPGEEASV